MAEHYRLIVVGGGSAGLSAARFAAALGVRVAIVERAEIGGDCTWTGCVPSKTLLHRAHLAHRARQADRREQRCTAGQVTFALAMAEVRATIERVYWSERPEALRDEGIEVVRGAARFVEPQTIDVQGRQLRADRFILCTGAEPMVPRIPGIESVPYLTHETVFDLTELPSRLLVLGGGPIGVELAQAFQRLGSAVTVLEREASILPEVDAEARALLAAQLQEDGVRLLTGNSVSHVAAHGSEIAAMVDGQIVVADAVLVATGRKPRVEELALDRAGVALGADGIAVDARLRTSQRHIYACGDVAAQVQLTHYAGFQGTIAARNALLPGSEPGTRPAVPWVLFTDPEVGQAGIRDEEARARWRDVRVTRLPLEQVDRAQTAGDTRGFIKLISRGVSGRLVGATVVASNGGELVNELALAIERRLRLSEVARVMHVYPTYGLGIQQAGAAALFDDLRSAGLQGKLLRLLARYWP